MIFWEAGILVFFQLLTGVRPTNHPSNRESVRPTVRPVLSRRITHIVLRSSTTILFIATTKEGRATSFVVAANGRNLWMLA